MMVISRSQPPETEPGSISELDAECDALGARIRANSPELLDAFHALELDLLTFAAMRARSRAGSCTGCVPELPPEALALKADEFEQRLRELVVTAAGYAALPAPDAARSHNQTPLVHASEADAVQALMNFHARDNAYALRSELARHLYADDGWLSRSGHIEGP